MNHNVKQTNIWRVKIGLVFFYFLTICILVDLSIHIDTISLGLLIMHFKGHM